ncbi:sugar phosphate isomerase/epimerase family protein [Kineococcus rhizosphaerae]|uniref:Sugar phosphate isomerase/epimerase n=1 Tax=Kineococcus rhizosphaerae TaxID=559628 RepID=A0A2T0RBL3_9ACTN|nr:sugar phosphate isomerase/epimerase family protein [Kineococcus rhizosphaerae]PRY18555.1 sugar phosphate isomerase/epimerase [Kineococcus rhizosphaerae]
MLLACSSPMVPAGTLTQKARLLRQWGFDALAVFWPLADWTPAVRAELVGLEAATGVRPVEFVLTDAVYGKAMDPDLDLRARCRAMYREAAGVCAELGAVTEIEFEYGPQDPLPLFHPFQQLDAGQREGFCTFYRELLEVVTGTAGRVLLEPLNRYESRYLNRVEDNLAILEEVAHPNAGLLPDTFHLSLEESDLGAALRRAGDHVAHVHLGDSNRLLPGHGLLEWEEVFAALRDIGYAGALNLECSTEGDPALSLPPTVARLRGLIAA